jgi:hypothetical protein
MASKRQIIANRRNARKSTGPITPEGKAASSQNSRRHGLLATTVVLEGESADRFHELLTSLFEELQPETSVEMFLVENMAVACWCQRRLWAMQSAGLRDEVKKQESQPNLKETLALHPATRASIAFRSLADKSRSLDLMNRYQSSYERQYDRTYRRFIDMREKSDFSKRTQLPPDLGV